MLSNVSQVNWNVPALSVRCTGEALYIAEDDDCRPIPADGKRSGAGGLTPRATVDNPPLYTACVIFGPPGGGRNPPASLLSDWGTSTAVHPQ